MNFLEKQLEDPVRFGRIKRWSCVGLVLIVLAEIVVLLIEGGHGHFSFEDWPAWGSVYGFVSCVAIIIVSKFIGKKWLMRREDHYDS